MNNSKVSAHMLKQDIRHLAELMKEERLKLRNAPRCYWLIKSLSGDRIVTGFPSHHLFVICRVPGYIYLLKLSDEVTFSAFTLICYVVLF